MDDGDDATVVALLEEPGLELEVRLTCGASQMNGAGVVVLVVGGVDVVVDVLESPTTARLWLLPAAIAATGPLKPLTRAGVAEGAAPVWPL